MRVMMYVAGFAATLALGCSQSPMLSQPDPAESSADHAGGGGPDSAADCRADSEAVFQGDFDTGEQGQRALSELRGVQEVTGALRIRAVESRGLDELACLKRVGGLSISANPQLVSLRGLAALTAVDEALELFLNPVLEEAELPNLETARELQISANPSLRALAAAELTEVGEIYLDHNDELTTLDFQSLQRVGGLYITMNRSLRTLSGFEGLTALSRLEIVENETLESIEALGNVWNRMGADPVRPEEDWGCESGGGGVRIQQNPALRSLRGLQGVRYIGGGLCITANAGLADLQGLNELISVSAGVAIGVNEDLEDLAGLQSLEFVGGTFLIHENARLETLDGLQRLRLVVRGLSITDNARLTSLDALSGLQFAGALDVSGNPALQDSDLPPALPGQDAAPN